MLEENKETYYEELKEKCLEDQNMAQEEEDESKSNIWNRDRIH